LNACGIGRINRHPLENDENCATERIPDTEEWLNWIGDLDDPNDSEKNCGPNVESDLEQGNGTDHLDGLENRDVSSVPNAPRLICHRQQSKRPAEEMSITVNAIKLKKNKAVK